MLQYQYVFGGDLSVVVWQWIVAKYSARFFGGFANGRLFFGRIVIKNVI